jgi:hypothetical protein
MVVPVPIRRAVLVLSLENTVSSPIRRRLAYLVSPSRPQCGAHTPDSDAPRAFWPLWLPIWLPSGIRSGNSLVRGVPVRDPLLNRQRVTTTAKNRSDLQDRAVRRSENSTDTGSPAGVALHGRRSGIEVAARPVAMSCQRQTCAPYEPGRAGVGAEQGRQHRPHSRHQARGPPGGEPHGVRRPAIMERN